MCYSHLIIFPRPDVFLGPVCPYVLSPVSRFASIWSIPVFTTGGMNAAFRHKTSEYRLLTCMAGTFLQFGEFFKHLLEEYSWYHVSFLYDSNSHESGRGMSMCEFTLGQPFSMMGGFKNENISHIPIESDRGNKSTYQDLLKKSSSLSRVIVVCASSPVVRRILLTADDMGLLSDGEFVFFNIDLSRNNFDLYKPWIDPNETNTENERAMKAFESVLTISSFSNFGDRFINFKRKVETASANILNSTENIYVNDFVVNFYDALRIYGIALKSLIEKGERKENITGEQITSQIWNKHHPGVMGEISFDKNGDRKTDFSLLDLNPKLEKFEVVKIYHGLSNKFETVADIDWPHRDGPPLDIITCDSCGWNRNYIFIILLIITLAILAGLVIGSVYIFRHYKEEANIASMTWKINAEDLMVGNMMRRSSIMRMCQGSIYSGDSMYQESRQMYVSTAYYKGCRVATKAITTGNFSLSRKLLIELKQMMDLHHDNLVRFYGVCMEQPTLVTEYCPRGSLQDILEEEEISLDWNFKYSLINDICKGLRYIHMSDMRVHGNLKSSNCVVDSRFVLKLTDFGLQILREREDSDEDSYEFYKSKLWSAPEVLRRRSMVCTRDQKGDVYSFGIILHEVAERNGTWGMNDNFLEPKEIIEGVSEGYLRPSVSKLSLDDQLCSVMVKCWSEDPEDRPDISTAKAAITKINKDSKSSNILDNLLTRMEQYANNLETLVEERTQSYLEEKEKCESLLHELLPPLVADKLIQKETVEAESFPAVTIYFSDIVGFTNISVESSPMEIVDLLNDLYTCFDSILQYFDVYKVETIGDAYMVVSGLPESNGESHAPEIGRMSLRILEKVGNFRIRHRPEDQLKIRIGLHSGPCVAGVVGTKMPRYCLFGDTVNTASRMESYGEPFKIHMSSTTASILQSFPSFKIEQRGEMDIKGKGKMVTYWLCGEEGPGNERMTSINYRESKRWNRKTFSSARGEFRHQSRKDLLKKRMREIE